MKVKIEVNSILLKKAIENFLSKEVTFSNEAEIIIAEKQIETDKKLVIIGKDLLKPFKKEDLIKILKANKTIKKQTKKELIKKRLEALTKEYIKKVMEIVECD